MNKIWRKNFTDMNLSIKLYDDILVTSSITSITLSPNYDKARNELKKIFNGMDEDTPTFSQFFAVISDTFNPTFSYNLYYLVNASDIAKVIKKGCLEKKHKNDFRKVNLKNASNKVVNFLNYFGFDINVYPTNEQLVVLQKLKERHIIEYYWVEGTAYPESDSSTQILERKPVADFNREQNFISVGNNAQQATLRQIKKNRFIKDFNMDSIKNRGLGAKIIILEKYATDKIERLSKNKNLNKKFTKNGVVVSINNELNEFTRSDNQIIHQIQTLLTLFASADETNPNDGIVPEADAVLGGINISDVSQNTLNITMAEIRKLLFKVNNPRFKNAILLFEFIMDVPISESGTESHPIVVVPDILEIINSMTKNENIIAVGGVGNNSTPYDQLESGIWTLEGLKYTDLSKNIPSFIMIGASVFDEDVDSFVIEQTSNRSKNFDAYIYTDFFVGFPKDDIFFTGTSGAGAVAAGIVTYLQGNAIQKNRKKVRRVAMSKQPFITTRIIKQLFKQNFMKGFPNKILTPTTLQKLWTDAQRKMRVSQ